jgi:hypothetical protein
MKLLPIVKEIEGTDNKKRLQAVKRILKREKIQFTIERYAGQENILIGKDKILFTAHHDTVRGSPGANDNASAIGVLIGLAKQRKAAIAIFAEEEMGCVGAQAYISKHVLPHAVVDLEMMGMGDTIAIWTVDEERPLLDKIRTALRKTKIPFEDVPSVPMFWADFTAFRDAGLKDAWCLTLAPSSERKAILRFATNPFLATIMALFGGMPKFFRHYHSRHDTSSALSEESLQLSLRAVISVYDELKK